MWSGWDTAYAPIRAGTEASIPTIFAPQSKPSRARDVPDTQPLESFRARLSKSLYYNDPNGEKVLVSANNRRAYKLLPLVGTVWRIDVNDRCRAHFEVTQPGVVVVP